MKKLNKNKIIVLSLALGAMGFFFSSKLTNQVQATGLSVGTSALTLGASDNLFYGNINSDSSTSSRFMLLQKNASTNLFGLTPDGGGYFMGNLGIGTSNPLANLHVNGSMYVLGGMGNMDQNDWMGNSSDALNIITYLSGSYHRTPTEYARGDINGDGRLDMLDLNLIVKQFVWLITPQEAHQDIGKYIKDSNFYIDYNGNVGIGWATTTPPVQKLAIMGGDPYFNYSLNVGGSRITGVATGTVVTDAVNFNQLNSLINIATSSLNHNPLSLDVIGGSPNIYGLSLNTSTQVLNLEPANGTYGGVLTAAAQSIAGAKTFAGLIAGSAGLTITGAAVNLNASSNFPINIGTGNSNGAITINNSANTLDLNPSTLSINTSDWDVSTTGSITGISGISNDGAYTQTGTSANTFSGIPAFSNATYSALFTGNVGIGTATPTTAKLMVDNGGGNGYTIDAGNSRIGNLAAATANSDMTRLSDVQTQITTGFSNARTATMDIGGNNLINVNKITVATIDPLYNIFGTNYSSYSYSIAGGVKEEYVGRFKIDTYRQGYGYEGVIDFNNLKTGSDLWVWRQVVDFTPDNVQAFFTPYGSFAKVHYLINNNKLTFRSDKPVTVSYRLIGKRFDWASWPTKALNQTEAASLMIN